MKPERWKQIEETYYRAIAREAPARTAFLDEACGEDEELRRQVESLLAYDLDPNTFLATPAMNLAAQVIDQEPAPFAAGTRLGHYVIVEQIGAGGMGEVYRATDIRLNREVAIKVLPTHLSQNTQALARFEREARAVAALSHPNILSIHEFGTEEGTCYAVTELLEGETIRSRLARSAIAWRQAVEIAAAIADGLSAAHAKGIIHRDLKPENLFLITDGRVKILDFGLARVTAAGSPPTDDSATALCVTEPGAMVGTLGYMSPEQVRGEKVSEPSDIFSLGCVLYEMLVGRRAFKGQTPAETVVAILRDEPAGLDDVDGPAELERIVAHCLKKEAQDRFHSAHDLSLALRALLSGSKQGETKGPLAPTLAKPRHRHAMWRWIFLPLGIAVLLPVLLYFRPVPEQRERITFEVSLPGTWIATELGNRFLAVSPDGQRLAFVVAAEGRRMLWLRPRDAVVKPLDGTEGATSLFWSPDSRWIGFFADGKLKKIRAGGGPPETLCDVAMGVVTGTWGGDGVILFAGEGSGSEGVYRVSDAGGKVTSVIKPDPSRGQPCLFWPHFLPDGRHFLYLAFNEQRKGTTVFIGALDTGQSRPLLETSSVVEYVPPGYLLYVREGTLLAQPFDAAALTFTGEPILIAEQVQYFNPTGYADFSSSASLLAYRAGSIASQLSWFDRNGRELGTIGEPGQYEEPRLSPDEKKVAVGLVDPRTGTLDIWTFDLTRDLSSRITALKPCTAYGPVWSADGRALAFAADIDGPPHLYRKTATGAGELEVLVPPGEAQFADDWSTDGRFLVYTELGAKTGTDVWVVPLFGDRKPYPYLNTSFNEKEPRFSPDGRWLAYVSDESGKNEVYVQAFQRPGEKWRISAAGGSQPVWRRDGKEIFYLAADNKLMAVLLQPGTTFAAGLPVFLFRIDPAVEHAYDVTADGQRFLVNTNLMRAESLPITIEINWTAALSKK